MIHVDGLSKAFGPTQAVKKLSFVVGRGELVGFVGLNGAGKTTTLRILSGFLEPDDGIAKIGGHDLKRDRVLACQHLGYMPEGAPLHEEMRVTEFLRYRAQLKRLKRGAAKETIAQLVDELELAEVYRRLISRLSKGYRQRVALADALLGDPPVLLLDEPMSGLDPLQRRSFRQIIERAAATRCVLFSSHVLPEVESLVSRFIVLHRGALLADGDLNTLRRSAGVDGSCNADELFAKLVEA